jgi:hypothetical protein
MTVEITPSRRLKNSFDQAIVNRALEAGFSCKGSFKQALVAIRRIVLLHNIKQANHRSTRYRLSSASNGTQEKAVIIAVRPTEKVIILTLQSD